MNRSKLSADTPNLEKWRKDTPGCKHRIHLNNAGAALMPEPVIEAIHTHIDNEARFGGYEAADAASKEVSESYDAIAHLIGTTSSNIAIVENATVAVAQALSAFDFQQGNTIITTNVDYSSNQIMLLNLAERFGVEIIRAEDLPEGGVDPDSVRRLIQKQRPKLVLMSWVPTNSGLIQDARAVGNICSEADIPFVLDGCQAVGQFPVDVTNINCDFLAVTARKFLRGPRGLGFLYVSDQILEQGFHPLFPDTQGAKWISADNFQLEPDAKRFENWEFPYALILGLGAAVKYANNIGIEPATKRVRNLAKYTREKLTTSDNMRVLDKGKKKGAIVTVEIEGIDAPHLVEELRKKKINTSASMRHHGVIDMEAKNVETALRISPHYYNTVEEIDKAVEVMQETISAVNH